MRPSSASLYSANGVLSNTVIGRNQPLQAIVCANSGDLFLRKLRCAAPFAAIGRAVADFVGVIVLRRIPAKISQLIIGWIAVVVAALHSIWSRPDESLNHKAMNSPEVRPVVAPQQNEWALILTSDGRLFQVPGFDGQHISEIGHPVKPLEADHIAPLFHGHLLRPEILAW